MSLVLALGLIACGGDDEEDSQDGGESTPGAAATTAASTRTATPGTSTASGGSTTTADGDAIAHEAMIVEADLPGEGWTVLSTDEFGDSLLEADTEEFADVPACQAYVSSVEAAAQEAEAQRIGRASKSFSKADALLGTNVDVEVAVYENGDVAQNLVSEAKDAFSSADFQECFQAIFQSDGGELPEDVQFELNPVDPLTDAPNDGVAQAFDLEFSASGVTISLHAELYAWVEQDATAFVSVFGEGESLTADLVEAAVGKTADKLEAAQ